MHVPIWCHLPLPLQLSSWPSPPSSAKSTPHPPGPFWKGRGRRTIWPTSPPLGPCLRTATLPQCSVAQATQVGVPACPSPPTILRAHNPACTSPFTILRAPGNAGGCALFQVSETVMEHTVKASISHDTCAHCTCALMVQHGCYSAVLKRALAACKCTPTGAWQQYAGCGLCIWLIGVMDLWVGGLSRLQSPQLKRAHGYTPTKHGP